MDTHEMKVELFERYYYQLASSGLTLAQDISDKQWNNAAAKFAQGADRATVIGFIDTSVMGSGKSGYLFRVC